MCSDFFIDDHRFSDFGKLQKFIGKGKKMKLPIHTSYENKGPSYKTCLCPVDVQGLVNMIKKRAVSDGMNYYFGDQADKIPEEEIMGPTYEIELQ